MLTEYNAHNVGWNDPIETIAAYLFYLGEPFACMSIFESIDEFGMPEDEMPEYKGIFSQIFELLNIQIEWENEYCLKKDQDSIYGIINDKYVCLWRGGNVGTMFEYMVNRLGENIQQRPTDAEIERIQSWGGILVSIIQDFGLDYSK